MVTAVGGAAAQKKAQQDDSGHKGIFCPSCDAAVHSLSGVGCSIHIDASCYCLAVVNEVQSGLVFMGQPDDFIIA